MTETHCTTGSTCPVFRCCQSALIKANSKPVKHNPKNGWDCVAFKYIPIKATAK